MIVRGLILLLAVGAAVPEPTAAQAAEDPEVLRAVLVSAREIVGEVRGQEFRIALRTETRGGYRLNEDLAEEAVGAGWIDFSCEVRGDDPNCEIRRELATLELHEPRVEGGRASVGLTILGLQRRPNSGFLADVLVRVRLVEGGWTVVDHQVLGIT